VFEQIRHDDDGGEGTDARLTVTLSNAGEYAIRGDPGETVVITLRSMDFDAFLAWGRYIDGEWQEVAADDDSAGESDARLTVTLGRADRSGLASASRLAPVSRPLPSRLC
jgi:hypothetical protein